MMEDDQRLQVLPQFPPLSFIGHIDLRLMTTDDLANVVNIENAVYSHPWTYGNFVDSLCSAYESWVACLPEGKICGYFLMMPVVDEMHLLNISVRADMQGQGLGRLLLDKICALARAQAMHYLLLEVRPTNMRAIDIYRRYGFYEIGRRRHYYPAANGQREDAIVMRCAL